MQDNGTPMQAVHGYLQRLLDVASKRGWIVTGFTSSSVDLVQVGGFRQQITITGRDPVRIIEDWPEVEDPQPSFVPTAHDDHDDDPSFGADGRDAHAS